MNETDVNLHIQISKELDNRLRDDKDLTRKQLVTKALETLLDEIEADNDAFKILIGAGTNGK